MLSHPNLHHIVLHEFDDCVVCRIHTQDTPPDDTEPIVTIWKPKIGWWLIHSSSMRDSLSLLLMPTAGFRLFWFYCVLQSSDFCQDFWVLEERAREQVYARRTEKKRERQGKGKARKMVVTKDYTFIPRFKYDLSVYEGTKKIQHQARVTLSPHLVSGHIRRLPEGHQHAEEFGIRFGDGETFVRSHERGEIEQLRNYRSRSAMQLLFSD